MNEQLLKDFIATAQKYNYNWNTVFGKFPELKGYDQQLLKDYVATAEKNNYDYGVVNSKFPELGFNQEPVKKKESTELASKSEDGSLASQNTKEEVFFLPNDPSQLYTKKGDEWYKKIGSNYLPLTKGDVAQRSAYLNQNAQKASQFDIDRAAQSQTSVDTKKLYAQDTKELKKSFEQKYGEVKSLEKINEAKRQEELKKQVPQESEKLNFRAGGGKIYDFDNENEVEEYKDIAPAYYMAYYDNNGKPLAMMDPEKMKEAEANMKKDFGDKEFAAYMSIDKIPSAKKLSSLGEQATSDVLNKQFEGTNLQFKRSGSELIITSQLGDGINATVLNEKTIDLSEPDADKKLKSFISHNIVKKSEREKFDNVQSVEDLVELVGSKPYKFKASMLEGMNVDQYFEKERQLLDGEMARAKADTYGTDLKSYEQKVIKFNQDVKGGKMSKVDFDAKSAELENERKSLLQRKDIMSKAIVKAEKIDKLTNNLEKANVITAEEKEKQGSFLGNISRGFGEGLIDVSQAGIDFAISAGSALTDAKTFADAITPGEYERLRNLGYSDDEIKNEIQKSVKNTANKVLGSVPDVFGFGTTEEYSKSADRGVIDQAAFAIGESLGAVAGGIAMAPAKAGTTAGFFSMSYNGLEDQMRGPQFDALSENEKKIMSVPYGLVIGALEKLGAKVATGAAKSKTLGMFSEYIMAKTFSSLPKNASLLEIKSAIDKSVALSVANGMLKITGAGIVEGGTEFTQQIFEGIEKDVANRIIQSNQLETAKEEGGGTVSKEIYNQIVKNKFFKDAADLSSLDGIQQLLKESGNAFVVGALAGGMGGAMSVGVAEPISNKVSNNKFAIYRDIILDDAAREGAISSINKKVENDQLTREEADEQIKSINESYPALRQIPTEFSVGAQREAFGLLMERESLDKEIKDKDPNLVAKQKERVAEINEQLKGLSYAVQEQGADAVPVQSGAGVSTEVETGVSKTEPQGVTGETITEKVEVEGPKAEQPQAEVAQEEVVQPSEEDNSFVYKMNTERTSRGKGKWEDDFEIIDNRNGLELGEEASKWAVVNKITGEIVDAKSKKDAQDIIKNAPAYGDMFGDGTTVDFTELSEQAQNKYREQFNQQKTKVVEEAVQPVVQETVQPTAQAQPTAKIETIEVQEVPQVDQTLNDLTQQNNVITQNDFTAAKVRNVGKEKVVAQIAKAAKAIAKVLPKVKIVVHATPEAFVAATKDMDGRLSEGGLYDQQTGEIHINLERANNRTVAHEVFHALILSMVKSDVEAQKLTRSMIRSVIKSLKKAEGTAELISYLEEFESNYDENIKNEEKLGELFAVLADNYKQLPPASKNVIIRFLNRLAKALGLKEMTDREAIAFMNTLSRKVETGQEIEAREVGKQKEGKAAVRKQIIGEVGAKKLDQQENSNLRMKNLKVANDMKDAGKTPKEIRIETGWEMGAEGKWRYETVDNLPFFQDTVSIVKKLQDEESIQYGMDLPANAVLPDELLKMYPELNDYRFDFGQGNENEGNLDLDIKKITVNIGNNQIQTVRTLLHEVQHAIQEIEGFDSGTSAKEIMDQFIAQNNVLRNRINRIKKYSPNSPVLNTAINNLKSFIDNFSTVNKNNERVLDKFNLYMRKAGEIEARNVEARMNMTAEERRNTLLTETEDIKDRQIIEAAPRKFAVRKQKGLINLTDQEAVKYARAGVENKYDAQAIKQIGLQGTKFDKTSILERIQKEFDGLVKNTTDYIFREDSPAIDQAIQNEIDTMVDQGYSNDQIENAKRAFSPGRERDNVINEYRRAQVETANQWESYLGQSDYPASFKYLILDAVLTNNYDLKTDRYQKRTAKTIRNFTPFDAGTLAELYMSESNELLKDYVRIQADNSANIVESAAFSSTKDGKWIKFDGGDGVSQQELQDNANKLSQLVQNTYWCTKTNALSQLRDGDFYVYVTENKQGDFDPRIAVRMDGDKVGEVRGNASSKQDLEADMLPVADTFLREKIPNDSGKKWLDSIAYNTKVKDLTDKIDNKVLDMDDVMDYIDILKDKDKFSVDYGENGLVQTLKNKFRNAKFSFGVADSQIDIKDDTLLLLAPNDMYTFMFRDNEQTKNVQVIIGNVNVYDDFDGGKVKAITGSVEFEDSSIKEIKSIESIGGNVSFRNSEIKYLGSLKEIGGNVSFRNSEVRYLGNLKSIGGRAGFRDSEVRSLENLEYIGGNADFYNSSIQDLGSLKEIGGSADFVFSSIKSLDSLKKIGGDANFEDSGVKDLGELTEVGGTINVNGSNIRSLGKLKKVGGSLLASSSSKLNDLGSLTEVRQNLFLFTNDNLKSLGKLKKVGRNLNISESSIEDLGDLESIGWIADFNNSKIKSLGKLKKIGRTIDLNYSEVEDLGELESIGGGISFENSKIESLGKLKEIGGYASFEDSNVQDLGALESIGGQAYFENSKVEDLGNLQFIGGSINFNGKPELREQWEQRQERQFAVRKQKTTGPSRIVENGVKAGKTDAQIRQEGKAAGFTNKEMTEALSKYYTKEQGIFMKSGIKGFVGRFVDGARKFKQKYLTSKGLLAKIGFTYKEKMEGEISAEANRAAKTAKKFGVLFDKFTGDKDLLLKAFDKALRGDKSIQLPAGFARLANEMRNHIDRLSQMLIDSGAVEGDMAEAIRDNMGTYITRSYEIFDNKNFRQKVGEQELQAAKNFLRTQPGMIALAQAEAARTGTTVDEALDALVDNKIDEYFADAETGALVKGSKLGSKDLSTLKERKEIPEQIRMLMGEYSDPAMNYARTVLNIASLAARHQFLTQVKEAGMGKFFFEKNDSQRPKGFDTEIAAEGSDTMSPLNGLMTTPEIAEAFGLYNGQKGEDNFVKKTFRLYYKAMGMVKWLKTIASFATHMKNVFSNLGFVGLNGHSLIEIGKAANVVLQDLKTMSKPEIEAKIDEYIKAGIMRQGAGINEIKDMFKDADMDDFLERRLSMRKPNKGVVGKIKQVISSKASKIKTGMEDLYQAEDDMFKIAAYETEMNRYADALYNKSKDQLTDKERQEVSDIATNNVKNTYPTYSRIPEGIKQLRKFPLFIGSFISFQAESYRTAYNTIGLAKDELSSDNKKIKAIAARRIAGAFAYLSAKTALLSYTGYAAGTGLSGVLGALFNDDDEEKKEKDVRSFLPPWSQNSDIIILKAADGEIEYIDFSASDPHGGINKALNALFRGEDMVDSFKQSMLELVGQFEGPDILTNLAIQLNNNENDFGKPIYNEEDSRENKISKVIDYVYKVVEPGTATSIRKAVASEQSLGQLAFGEATGLKIRKVNVKDQFGYKLPEFDDSFKDIRKIYNSEYYKNERLLEDSKATNKDINEQQKKTDDAYVRANEQYAAKAKELMDLINSANRLGVDYDELIDQLESIKSTMGKSNIYEMEDGGTEFIKEK